MKLLHLRKQSKKTQTDVAQLLNIDQTTYSGYETGKSKPDIETLITLADYYGVSLDYICDHQTENQISLGVLKPIQKNIIHQVIEMNDLQLLQTQAYIYGLSEKI